MLSEWTVDELLKLLKLINLLFLHPEVIRGNQDNEIGTRIVMDALLHMVQETIDERVS